MKARRAILSDVTEIAISTDAFDGADTIGIDNFAIASAIPVPTTVWLFGTGLIELIGGSASEGMPLNFPTDLSRKYK
jgi:hypothetical protein